MSRANLFLFFYCLFLSSAISERHTGFVGQPLPVAVWTKGRQECLPYNFAFEIEGLRNPQPAQLNPGRAV